VLADGKAANHGPRIAEQARSYSRHLESVAVDDRSHWLHEEQPEETARQLLKILA
jgi:pimeloyl-ACP methyl ester carboxylesterase